MIKRLYTRKELQKGKETPLRSLGEIRLVHKDICNLKYMYWMMHEWFIDKGWTPRSDQTFPEVDFIQRETAIGNEMWWRWRFKKKSKNGPFRWHMDIDLHVLGAKQVEIVVNGQKVKADNAEIEMFIGSALYMLTSKWDDNSILKHFKETLMKTFYRKSIANEEDEFERHVMEYQEFMKTYFRQQTFLSERQAGEFYKTAEKG